MEPEKAKAELKKIIDEAIDGDSLVESTLEPREYYVYTWVWQITTEQLDKIRTKATVDAISVDGGKIMLTCKI